MRRRRESELMNRNEAIKRGLLGAAGLAALGVPQAYAAPRPAKAKSVIQIWMWGGPSHIDTFDPKPDAGYDYCGPLKDTIKTNADGIVLGSSLPLLAKQADKFSILRGMTHGVNAHETASYMVQTGRKPDRLVYPSAGAVVSKFKGVDAGYKGIVPPYIVLTQPQGRFSEAGFLGPKYKPFSTGGDPRQEPFVVEGVVQKGISDKRQRDRRQLMHNLDTLGGAMPGNESFELLDETETNAYDLMFGEARELFNLKNEKDELRDRYGRTTFGQACLVARRLVEQGVPYITINYKGWDTHKQHFNSMTRMLPELDAGFATLLEDLSDRGLLDTTIVWWGGEFGRGPKVQWNAPWNGGRSHYGKCFSSVVAGGGFKGGHVVGASNDKAMEVVDRPVWPHDMIGSVYELMGIDPEGALPNDRGLNLTVLPTGDDVESGGRLSEIM